MSSKFLTTNNSINHRLSSNKARRRCFSASPSSSINYRMTRLSTLPGSSCLYHTDRPDLTTRAVAISSASRVAILLRATHVPEYAPVATVVVTQWPLAPRAVQLQTSVDIRGFAGAQAQIKHLPPRYILHDKESPLHVPDLLRTRVSKRLKG